MRPLTLCQFFQSDYDPRVANAFIYYASAKTAYDHHDMEIGQFMPKANGDTFEDHMRTVLIPIITAGLLKTPYQPVYIDHYNNSPQPSLGISRKDAAPLTKDDMQAIKLALEATLTAHNKKVMPAKMFSKHLKHDPETLQRAAEHAHHYETRSKFK